jgi:hypothetical protein
VKLVIEALAFGLLYCRLSTPTNRSKTIVFSDKAVIRRIRGKLYFMVQLCEVRKTQLIGASIALYAIRRDVDPDCELSIAADNVETNETALDGTTTDFASNTRHAVPGISSWNVPWKFSERRQGMESDSPAPKRFASTYFQTCRMRLNHPNDELDRNMLLILPQVVVHELDAWSPLMAPPTWVSADTGERFTWSPPGYSSFPEAQNGTIGRKGTIEKHTAKPSVDVSSKYEEKTEACDLNDNIESDFDVAVSPSRLHSRGCRTLTKVACSPVAASETYGRQIGLPEAPEAPEAPGRDSKLSKFQEKVHNIFPNIMQRCGYNVVEKASVSESSMYADEQMMLKRFLKDRNIEIVAVLEGIDATTNGAVQVRHSYKAHDIEWDKAFAACVHEDLRQSGGAVVDFNLFHSLVDTKADAPTAGHIQSIV